MFYFETYKLKEKYFSRNLLESSSYSDISQICLVKKTPSSSVNSSIRTIYGDNYEIIPTGILLEKAIKNSVPFSKELMEECKKIDRLTYFIVPRVEDEKTRSVGGFSDGNITVIGIRKVGLRNIFKTPEEYINSLSPNAFYYLISILIHELTHHVCSYSNVLFTEYRNLFNTFVTTVFEKAYNSPSKLQQIYMSLLKYPERSENNFQVETELVREYSRLNKEMYLHKDKQLAKEIYVSVNALVSGNPKVASILYHSRAVQEVIYSYYEKILKTGLNPLRTITFGQELLIPSEILSVVSQFAVYNVSISRSVAEKMLKNLK